MKSGTIELHLDAEAHAMLALLSRVTKQPARESVKYALSCAVLTLRQQLEAMGVRPDHADAARHEGSEAQAAGESPATEAAPAQA